MNKLTEDDYIYKLKILNEKIKLLGKFINTRTNSQHRCECGNEDWNPTPKNVLKGQRCKFCAGKNTHEIYLKKLKDKQIKIKVIGEYIDANTSIPHECTCGNNNWLVSPSEVLRGRKCRECCKYKKIKFR